MSRDVLTTIQSRMGTFSKGQKLIGRYILENYDKAAFMTAAKLGQTVKISESTVVRFAAELGYDGYPAMQKAMQEMIRSKLTTVQRIEVSYDRLGTQDVLDKVVQSDIEKLRMSLAELSRADFAATVEAIVAARRIYILGVRSSAALSDFLTFYFKLIFDNVCQVQTSLASEMFGAEKIDKNQSTRDYLGIQGSMKGKKLSMEVNGKSISYEFFGDNPTIGNTLNAINKELGKDNLKADIEDGGALVIRDQNGKKVDYTATGDDNIAAMLAARQTSSYTQGQDAILNVSVNGQDMTITRSTNNVEIDGMTITAKEEFGYKKDENGNVTNQIDPSQKVTFKSSVNSDQIVDAIKGLITDFNEVMSEVKSAYSTMPYKKSDGTLANYEPLTEADMEGMSESAIQKYEEKAKQGLLFNDSNLSALYNRMLNVFSPGGEDEALLRQMGISVSFSATDNSSSITLDEGKLRDMLDSDPDAVADLFTRSASAGNASSDGLMQSMKTQLDRYAGTTGAVKGILVQQAGTPLSSLTLMNNTWQNQIDSIYTDIEKWQDKLTAQVDKYTSMFSKLETLIYQMNSQSSTLAGMMGMGG